MLSQTSRHILPDLHLNQNVLGRFFMGGGLGKFFWVLWMKNWGCKSLIDGKENVDSSWFCNESVVYKNPRWMVSCATYGFNFSSQSNHDCLGYETLWYHVPAPYTRMETNFLTIHEALCLLSFLSDSEENLRVALSKWEWKIMHWRMWWTKFEIEMIGSDNCQLS